MTDAKMIPMTNIDVALPVPAQEEEYEMHQIAVARGEVFIAQIKRYYQPPELLEPLIYYRVTTNSLGQMRIKAYFPAHNVVAYVFACSVRDDTKNKLQYWDAFSRNR